MTGPADAPPPDEAQRGATPGALRPVAHALAFVPTRRAALVTAAIAAVWLATPVTSSAGWLAVALLAVALAADAALVPGGADLDLEREAPSTVGLGDDADGRYVVRSRWPRTVRARLYDRPPRAVEIRPAGAGPLAEPRLARAAGDGTRYAPLSLPAGGEAAIPVVVVGRSRGRFDLGPTALRVEGPLGLVARTLHYSSGGEISVAPSVAGVRRVRLLALQHRLRDAGLRVVRRRGSGTTFANLREYAVGDDPRHVDWKATARRGRPVVREYSVEQGQTVLIAVDAGRLMTQLATTQSRFEHALSSALVLADVALSSGDLVGLLVFDDLVRAFVPPGQGRGTLQAIREALVPAQASTAESDYAAAFRTLAERHRRRSLIVLFTDVIDPRASQALIAHATRGAVRHLPLVVALRNDQLVSAASPAAAVAGAATADARSTMRLYEVAAAEELLSAREDALSRMRRAGVEVVDVSPLAMTAAVVNRYLEIKARATL